MPPTRPLIAETLDEFLKHVSTLQRDWSAESSDIWFRGQQKAHWDLMPKLYREYDTESNVEDEIREEFSMRAPDLLERVPANEWDWYFLMQHFGASTRLLDWTEGALIGLYFAVRDNQGYQDAAVWMLDAWWLNETVIHRSEVLPPGGSGCVERGPETVPTLVAWSIQEKKQTAPSTSSRLSQPHHTTN